MQGAEIHTLHEARLQIDIITRANKDHRLQTPPEERYQPSQALSDLEAASLRVPGQLREINRTDFNRIEGPAA